MSLLGVIASQTFVPNQIADLVMFLDGADTSPTNIIEAGGAVSLWRDKSNSGNDVTQTTGSAQPLTGVNNLNGKNVIAFDGADDFMEKLSFSASINTTIIFVTKIISSSNQNDGILTMDATNDFQIDAGPSGGFRARFFSVGLGMGSAPQTPASIIGIPSLLNYRLSNNDSNIILRLNGTQVDSDTYNGGLDPSVNFFLGRNRVGNLMPVADIAEVHVFNRDLELSEIIDDEGYLMNKWGI